MHCRSQTGWELLHPFAHHCQHASNNVVSCCARFLAALGIRDMISYKQNWTRISRGRVALGLSSVSIGHHVLLSHFVSRLIPEKTSRGWIASVMSSQYLWWFLRSCINWVRLRIFYCPLKLHILIDSIGVLFPESSRGIGFAANRKWWHVMRAKWVTSQTIMNAGKWNMMTFYSFLICYCTKL